MKTECLVTMIVVLDLRYTWYCHRMPGNCPHLPYQHSLWFCVTEIASSSCSLSMLHIIFTQNVHKWFMNVTDTSSGVSSCKWHLGRMFLWPWHEFLISDCSTASYSVPWLIMLLGVSLLLNRIGAKWPPEKQRKRASWGAQDLIWGIRLKTKKKIDWALNHQPRTT